MISINRKTGLSGADDSSIVASLPIKILQIAHKASSSIAANIACLIVMARKICQNNLTFADHFDSCLIDFHSI